MQNNDSKKHTLLFYLHILEWHQAYMQHEIVLGDKTKGGQGMACHLLLSSEIL